MNHISRPQHMLDDGLRSPLRGWNSQAPLSSGFRPRLCAAAASRLKTNTAASRLKTNTAASRLKTITAAAASTTSKTNCLLFTTALFVLLTTSTALAQDDASTSPKATVVSRTQTPHAAHVLKRYRFDENYSGWVARDRNHPFTENTISESNWEIFPSGYGVCARRIGEKEFRIFTLFPSAPLKHNCYGTNPTGTNNLRRFAYLRNSNAYISHRPFFHENKPGPLFEGEASTLIDRKVDAITWTGDGRYVVYCRIVKLGYQLVAYNLGDDDYSVLLEFQKSETNPVLGSGLTDVVYLVTGGNTIRRFSLPITASPIRFASLTSIPVIHQTVRSKIVNIYTVADKELNLFETEPDGSEYKTVLKLPQTPKTLPPAKSQNQN